MFWGVICKKVRIFTGFSIFLVLDNNHFCRYISYVTFFCLLYIIICDSPIFWFVSTYGITVRSLFKYSCLFVSSNKTNVLSASNPKENELEIAFNDALTGYFQGNPSKLSKVTLTESSRGYSICPSPNKTPSISPSVPGSKIKSLNEDTWGD